MEKTQAVQNFWSEMERCLDTLRKPFQNPFQLAPAIKQLRQGAEAGDPELMFLWAEFLFWGTMTPDLFCWFEGASFDDMGRDGQELEICRSSRLFFDYGETYKDKILFLFDDPDEVDEVWYQPGAYYWYEKSAKAGYVPAMCWLGWCAMRGIGMEKDEQEMECWFRMAKDFPPLPSLAPDRLNLFVETAIDLGHLSRDADLDEDIAMDQGYEYSGTGWRDLFSASQAAYKLGCKFGCPRCALPDYEFQAYDYTSCDSEERRRMAVEKRMWQIYCAINNIGMKEVAPATLQAWRVDIDCAIHYDDWRRHDLVLSEDTQELLHQLTGEVLRR